MAIRMDSEEVSVDEYFEELYEYSIDDLSEAYEMIRTNKKINMDYMIYSLENQYNCLGIINLCYRKNLKEAREYFYKATLAREWFFEQLQKKEYMVEIYRVSSVYFEKLYDGILSGNRDRAVHMAELYGSVEVEEEANPATIMLGYGLKYAILDDKEKTLEFVKMMEENKAKRGLKQYADGEAHVFRGLVERDEEELNKGLEFMLKHHVAKMKREGRYLEQFFAYNSVALAMLAKDRGMEITVKHELLPEEYLEDVEMDYSELKLY